MYNIRKLLTVPCRYIQSPINEKAFSHEACLESRLLTDEKCEGWGDLGALIWAYPVSMMMCTHMVCTIMHERGQDSKKYSKMWIILDDIILEYFLPFVILILGTCFYIRIECSTSLAVSIILSEKVPSIKMTNCEKYSWIMFKKLMIIHDDL